MRWFFIGHHMLRKIVLLSLLLIPHFPSFAQEFLYPVAPDNRDPDSIYIIRQLSLDNIQLWRWNRQTKRAVQELCSLWTPAGLRCLPSGNGISFLHHGLPKIKFFHKRSPKTVGLTLPLYNLSAPEWLNDSLFYFYAKHHSQKGYAIYSSTIDGEVTLLADDKKADCLYPSIKSNSLFYIKRSIDGDHFLVTKKLNSLQEGIAILALGNTPSAFLNMHSTKHGYFMEYDVVNSLKKEMLKCSFYSLECVRDIWQKSLLFSFFLPLSLVIGSDPNRLYESIAPCLPSISGSGQIAFIDYGESGGGSSVSIFNLKQRSITHSYSILGLPVGLCWMDGHLYMGGRIDGVASDFKESSQCRQAFLWIDDQDNIYFDIPCLM